MACERPWSEHLRTLSSWGLPEDDMRVVLTLLRVGSLKAIDTSGPKFPFQDKLRLVIRQAPSTQVKIFLRTSCISSESCTQIQFVLKFPISYGLRVERTGEKEPPCSQELKPLIPWAYGPVALIHTRLPRKTQLSAHGHFCNLVPRSKPSRWLHKRF
jgi:hypothetical protein